MNQAHFLIVKSPITSNWILIESTRPENYIIKPTFQRIIDAYDEARKDRLDGIL